MLTARAVPQGLAMVVLAMMATTTVVTMPWLP